MKLHVFLAMCSQNKTVAVSIAVLVSSIVGGSVYLGSPDGQSSVRDVFYPTEQAAAHAYQTEPVITLSNSQTMTKEIAGANEKQSLETTKETAANTTKGTTEDTTKNTTQDTSSTSASATTQNTTKAAVQTTQPSVKKQNITTVPVTKETKEATTAQPPETTAKLGGTFNNDKARQVLNDVNEQRTAAGLPALQWNSTLAASAKIRSVEIVVCWSHTRPDGSPWYTAGSQMEMGENLAYGQNSSQQVVKEWMASKGHAENILRGSYTQMGVACYIFEGTYYWAQHFA